MNGLLVSVEALVKSYDVGTQKLFVLRDLDLAVRSGEMVAIMGASGVGKSTLLHLLGGLDRAGFGRIVVADLDNNGASDLVVTSRGGSRVLLAAGQHAGPVLQALTEADALQQFFRATRRFACRHPRNPHRHLDVLERRELRQQVMELEDEADVPVPELDQRRITHRR